MTIRRLNPRKQGEIGLGAAIAWFSQNGYSISIPLIDSQPYELVVDDGEKLHRVQVKTTTCRRRPDGSFQVALQTTGGNRSRTKAKQFDNYAVEYLFVLTDDGSTYLFPSAEIVAKSHMTLGPTAVKFRLIGASGSLD